MFNVFRCLHGMPMIRNEITCSFFLQIFFFLPHVLTSYDLSEPLLGIEPIQSIEFASSTKQRRKIMLIAVLY